MRIFVFGGSSFRVVSPATYEYEDDNAKSLGIRLEYGDNSFLLCGDCTAESEQALASMQNEFLTFVSNSQSFHSKALDMFIKFYRHFYGKAF